MDSINVRVAKRLLEIKAVFLRPQEPFTWASGIKSPIYCDNRLILTAPEARNEVEQAIADTVKREYPEAEVLMGTATAGIAHAAIAAHLLGLPMGYVRSGNKDHGRQNRIEGRLDKGEKVVVVEDLISTGGSVLETVEALREAGAEVLGVVSSGGPDPSGWYPPAADRCDPADLHGSGHAGKRAVDRKAHCRSGDALCGDRLHRGTGRRGVLSPGGRRGPRALRQELPHRDPRCPLC